MSKHKKTVLKMDISKLTRKELELKFRELEDENSYLKHLTLEMETDGLQLNSMLYQLMLNNLPFTAWMKDTTGRFISVNRLFEEKNGKSSFEIISKTDYDFSPADLAKEYVEEDKMIIKTKTPMTVVKTYIENGLPEYYETYKAPVFNNAGSVIATFGFSKKISNQYKSEISLKQNEEKFRSIIDELPLGIYRSTINGEFIHVNKTLALILGVDNIEEIKNKNAFDFFEERSQRKDLLKRLKESNSIIEEYELVRVDGKKVLIKDYSKLVNDSNGTFIDGYIEVIDASINQKYEIILENSFYGVYINEGSRIEYANSKLCEILGYSKEELTSPEFNLFSVVDSDYQPLIKKRLEDLINGEVKNLKYEIKLYNKHGKEIYAQVASSVINDSNNKKLLGIVRDITEQKKAESLLIESNEKFKLIAENIPGVVYLCKNDEKFTTIYANNAIEQLFGRSSDDFMSEKCYFTDFYHPDDIQMMTEKVNDALSKRTSYHLFFRVKQKDGSDKWVEEYGAGVFINDTLLYLEGVIFDISNRIILEETLMELNHSLECKVLERTAKLDDALEELRLEISQREKISSELLKTKDELAYLLAKEKELNKLKNSFISMVSHEYRTPLTVILTSTYLLERFFATQDSDGFKSNLTRIRDSIQIIIKLLEDVILIGNDQNTTLTNLQLEKLEFVSLIKEIYQESQFHTHKELKFGFNSLYKSILIEADPLFIRHIFSNLLSNAIKYTNSGKNIYLDIASKNNNLIIKINDEGIGIPKEETKYLFEPFHRFTNVGAIQGTGLGLAIVKRATDALGWKIEVESEVGNGSSFSVIIPINEKISLM